MFLGIDKEIREDRAEEVEEVESARSHLLETSEAKPSLRLPRRTACASGGLVLLLAAGAVALHLRPGATPAALGGAWAGEVQQLHGNSPEHSETACQHASGAFTKLKHLVSLETRNHEASAEVKEAGREILKGVRGEEALRHIQTVLDGATLNSAAQLGEVFTEHDMSLVIACELGHEVDQGSDISMPPGEYAGERWPHGLMPFCYHPTCEGVCQEHVEKGIKAITDKVPCVSIRQISYDAAKDRCSVIPSVMIRQPEEGGCNSQVGVSGWYKRAKESQILNAPSWCQYKAKLAHELQHALGIKHEQVRPDRDSSVTIHWENIKSGKGHNFELAPKGSTAEQYDYLSIMHYSARSFSKNGEVTIEPSDPAAASDMGQREGLTNNDAEQICRMYGCLNKCAHIADPSKSLRRAESRPAAPITKKKCQCRPTWTHDGRPCGPESDSCCNLDGDPKGTWCYTTSSCDGLSYDYCQRVTAPTTKKGCTCQSGWSYAGNRSTASTGHCFNPDSDINGPWCYISDSKACGLDKSWDYCDPKPR